MTAFITFNGKSSLDFQLKISNEMKHYGATNDVETIQVLGRDGDILIDNKRLNAFNQPIPFHLIARNGKSVSVIASEINEWLSVPSFVDFTKSWDPDHIYKATVIEEFDVEETLRWFGKAVITFRIQPIKYLKTGLTPVTIRSTGNLNNPTNRDSKPLMEVTTTGNVNITINGKVYKLVNPPTNLVIDSETMQVYSGSAPRYDVLDGGFPILNPGNNSIQLSNTNTTLKITPRWGVRAN